MDKMNDEGNNNNKKNVSYLLQGQWNVIQEAAVAATKVIRVITGILVQAVSTTHPQIVILVERMKVLLPSTHLEHCYTAVIPVINTWPVIQ
jgi:hypothetical protein